ncbi:uncharacterized protein LOC133795961 [Humulus lupulus]|uniref:uncharacterized protein LOC133795961 n=1 Tax=Humulus lupulus TaxID=3486 RepID=UPI002B416953|nr:uncharacterized protein LOC133795961 [Humulus lupulus]
MEIYYKRNVESTKPIEEHVQSAKKSNVEIQRNVQNNLKQEVKDVTLQNSPENAKSISPEIQKNIIRVVANEFINVIVKGIRDALFSIVVEEPRGISMKEQMVVVLRYVDKKGIWIEIARLRGQGYDEASNMQCEFNGLKTLILKENSSAYYIHCLAHQLQLALVSVGKKHDKVSEFFCVVNTSFLLCVSCLSPDNLFVAFEKQMLIQLVGCYPKDFSAMEFMALDDQLQNYIGDMHPSIEFLYLKGINHLAKKIVEMGKDKVYPLVNRLLILSSIFPIATATVERVFYGMHFVKTKLHNRIGDQWLNDKLIIYIEKEIYDCIDNEVIMRHFQNIKTRCGNL